MKQQIDNLIAKILLTEGEVYLPSVGRLILYRHPAQLASKSQLNAPYRELKLEKEEQGRSIISHIVDVANISEERASDIYTEWLSQSLRNEVLTIVGVCTIKGESVTIDESFEEFINGEVRETITLKPRKSGAARAIIAIAASVVVGFSGYVLYEKGVFDNILERCNQGKNTESVNIAINEPIEPENIAADTTAVEIVNHPDSLTIATIQPDSTATAIVENIESDSTTIVAVAEPDSVAVVAVTEPEMAENINPSVLPMTAGHSYAVWGVYNELKNAEEAKAWLAAKFPKIEANIYRYDARYMVALHESESREACNNKIKRYKAQSKSFKNVWAYTR